MADETDQANEDSAPEHGPVGFAKLSRKISSRTTDLLAVAILAVGLLAIGGNLSRWWQKSPEDAAHSNERLKKSTAWGSAGDGVSLEWGDLNYAVHRQRLTGDAESIGEQLKAIVIRRFPKIPLPNSPPKQAEQKLLKELESIPITQVLDADTRLYLLGEQLPMILLTKPTGESRRVICWARAFPRAENDWIAFLFFPSEKKELTNPDFQPIPLPPDSRRIQTIQEAGQRSWTAFRGPGPVLDWHRHFDKWFTDQAWNQNREWSRTPTGWSAGFGSRKGERQADVWLNQQASGEWTGMIFVEQR